MQGDIWQHRVRVWLVAGSIEGRERNIKKQRRQTGRLTPILCRRIKFVASANQHAGRNVSCRYLNFPEENHRVTVTAAAPSHRLPPSSIPDSALLLRPCVAKRSTFFFFFSFLRRPYFCTAAMTGLTGLDPSAYLYHLLLSGPRCFIKPCEFSFSLKAAAVRSPSSVSGFWAANHS